MRAALVVAALVLAFVAGAAVGDQLGYAQARRFDARWYARP